MSAGTVLKHKRKATDFVAGELQAGEMGLNITTGRWFFSINGTTVTALDRPFNASVADQTVNANSTALLTGSALAIPAGRLRVGTELRWRLCLSKTAAGTNSNSFIVQLGTTGSLSDADLLTFALPAGTAVIDTGIIEIVVTVRGPLGASCVARGSLSLIHNLSATGLATIPCVVLCVTSATFNSAVDNLIASVVCNTAPSTVLTFQQVNAEALNV
jgi:hypothetical protein